jgi:hypothetical protein
MRNRQLGMEANWYPVGWSPGPDWRPTVASNAYSQATQPGGRETAYKGMGQC